jgi:hypothetical protein
MKTQRRTPRSGNVFDDLAQAIQQTVRDVHANDLSGLERFTVATVSPFTIGQVQGELMLEDGDPDFTVGETLRARLAAAQVNVGDLVWVGRHDGDFHAFDVVSR